MPGPDLNCLDTIRHAALPITGQDECYDPLLKAIGDSRLVLIGEASHGTEDFYRERARITRRLIAEKGFCAVAVEADWPDAYRVNRYVLNLPSTREVRLDASANEALGGFRRFPEWMWRNTQVLDFLEWLRTHNQAGHHRAGFYGLDLYSLFSSAQAVLEYLEKTDPEAAARARSRYGCFEDFEEDTQAYGYAASYGMTESCEEAVLAQLTDLQTRNAEFASWDGPGARREAFSAEQNALLVRNSERYYRLMFDNDESSWNLRDTHMADTLDRLLQFLGPTAKVVVWAHNSHLGDARATEMGRGGELNLGQLTRERHPGESFHIGFTTYTGDVTAANKWGELPERKRVRPALQDSYEQLFHHAAIGNAMLILRRSEPLRSALAGPLLERAIGVIYRPRTERQSHYFRASLPEQFDAVLHIDETRALTALDQGKPSAAGEPPETYPSSL